MHLTPFSRLALAALIWAATLPVVATDCERVEAGDTVFAACPGVPFAVDSDTQSPRPLGEGVEIQVSGVTGDRIQGVATVDGETRSGWIPADKVQKPDDPECVAALREFTGVELHQNRHGSVERIDAHDSDFGGDLVRHLDGLYSLEGLELSGARITNDDLCALEDLSNLRWLYLDRTSVNDEGLLSLRHLTRLEVLVLSASDVCGPGLVHLTKLRKLRVLNLSGCQLDDDALRHLQGLRSVQTLALENAEIRGDGLAYLRSMDRLNVLNLNGCSLRPGTLLHLQNAQYLRIVRVREAEIPQADRDQLRAANPRLAIFN